MSTIPKMASSRFKIRRRDFGELVNRMLFIRTLFGSQKPGVL